MEAHQLTNVARELKDHFLVSSAIVRGFAGKNYAESDAVALEVECSSIPEDVTNMINYENDVKIAETTTARHDRKMSIVVWTRK